MTNAMSASSSAQGPLPGSGNNNRGFPLQQQPNLGVGCGPTPGGQFGSLGAATAAAFQFYGGQFNPMIPPHSPFSPTGYMPFVHGFPNPGMDGGRSGGGGNPQSLSNSNGSGSSPVENTSPVPNNMGEVDPNLIHAMHNLGM